MSTKRTPLYTLPPRPSNSVMAMKEAVWRRTSREVTAVELWTCQVTPERITAVIFKQ
jgi:hypothetical protein